MKDQHHIQLSRDEEIDIINLCKRDIAHFRPLYEAYHHRILNYIYQKIQDNDLADKRIRTAIENNLLAKSYRLVDSYNPDFFISYHLTVEQKITSSGVSGGVSIGRSSRGRYGGVGVSTGSQVRAYDQGTLLIDVTIPLGDKLVWRGIATQAVSDHSSPEESTVRINETVEKILAQFPPK